MESLLQGQENKNSPTTTTDKIDEPEVKKQESQVPTSQNPLDPTSDAPTSPKSTLDLPKDEPEIKKQEFQVSSTPKPDVLTQLRSQLERNSKLTSKEINSNDNIFFECWDIENRRSVGSHDIHDTLLHKQRYFLQDFKIIFIIATLKYYILYTTIYLKTLGKESHFCKLIIYVIHPIMLNALLFFQ